MDKRNRRHATKKDYEGVARAINAVLREHPGNDPDTVLVVAHKLADYFASENEHFDRDRFIAAVVLGCGRNTEERPADEMPDNDTLYGESPDY